MARYTETIYPVKKLVPLTTEMAEAIGEYRHQQRISSENEAIRRLIEAGLNLAAKSSASPSGSAGSSRKPERQSAAAEKPPPRKPPRAKPLAMSKEAQIRALRERDGKL